MDENKINMPPQPRGKIRTLTYALTLTCAIFALSGCGMDILPTRSMEGDIENAKSHMKKPRKATREEVAQALEDEALDSDADNYANNTIEQEPLRPVTKSPVPQRTTLYSNPKNLFGTDLRSNEDRLDRLERSVQDLRNDFENVRPSIKRLMAIEGDIQNLITELKRLNDDPSLASSSQNAFRPNTPTPIRPNSATPVKPAQTAKAAPSQTKTPPPVQGGKASIYDIRVGEHPGKTRIVFDANAKTSFDVDIDNGEKIMVVELPDASWSAKNSMRFGNSSFVNSYSVEPSGNGSMAIFQLKRNAKIGYKADLGGTGAGRRLVVDLVGE